MYLNPASKHTKFSIILLGVIPFSFILYLGSIFNNLYLFFLFFISFNLILKCKQKKHVIFQLFIVLASAYLILSKEVTVDEFHIIDSTGFLLRTLFPDDYKEYDLYYYVSLFYRFLIPNDYIVSADLFSLDIIRCVVAINIIMLYLSVSLFIIFQNKVFNFWLLVFIVGLIFLTPTGYKWTLYAGKESFILLLLVASIILYGFVFKFTNYLLISILCLIIFVGSITRPYFIVFIISSLLLLNDRSRFISFFRSKIALISLLIFFTSVIFLTDPILYSKSIALNFLGILSSPLPTIINIQLFFIEVIVNLLILNIIFITVISNKKYFTNIFLSVSYLSVTMVLVVMYTNHLQGTDYYGIYYSRTRFPFYMIFLLSLSMVNSRKRCNDKQRRIQVRSATLTNRNKEAEDV
jgi:hypothetical protein